MSWLYGRKWFFSPRSGVECKSSDSSRCFNLRTAQFIEKSAINIESGNISNACQLVFLHGKTYQTTIDFDAPCPVSGQVNTDATRATVNFRPDHASSEILTDNLTVCDMFFRANHKNSHIVCTDFRSNNTPCTSTFARLVKVAKTFSCDPFREHLCLLSVDTFSCDLAL